MRDDRLYVVARIRASHDQIDRVHEVLSSLVAPTRAEEGCLRYDLLRSDDDPAEFIFLEEWTGEPALTRHFASRHFEMAGEQLTGLLAAPTTIARYTRVD